LALTRSQLIAGNSSFGTVLAGQPQGVTAGTGVTISSTGVLSIDLGPSFNGFIKTNNLAAYNGYVWPGNAGTAGQQLQSDGAGGLTWADSDGIPWTAKGQLIVGTGIGLDTLLNVGTDTSVLVANSGSTAGVAWSNALTSAIQLPAGNSGAQRPATPAVGMIRYNTVNNEFEGYSGAPAQWQALGGMPTGGGTDKIFYENGQIITTNYTVGPNENAMTAGSIVVNAGVTVTVSAGSTWTVV
jgi:hypothetical protein